MRAAKEMEFMEAARLRDELELLRNRLKELAVAK
jgi:excinuclease UvrABC nuclease subunit